jgi:hypothetical protein
VKDGGAMTTDDHILYAIKSGSSTAFWKWTASSKFSMSTDDTIPHSHNKSLAKTGAALVYANGAVWLLKGNNTPEFWKYVPTTEKSNIKTDTNRKYPIPNF